MSAVAIETILAMAAAAALKATRRWRSSARPSAVERSKARKRMKEPRRRNSEESFPRSVEEGINASKGFGRLRHDRRRRMSRLPTSRPTGKRPKARWSCLGAAAIGPTAIGATDIGAVGRIPLGELGETQFAHRLGKPRL